MSEIILFTGPHGAGKDSIEKRVRGERRDIRRIVRHITREPASGEQRDEDYHFVTRDQFRSLAAAGHFIEWVEYPDVLSGTAFGEIEGVASEKTFASLTLNLEDALELRRTLQQTGRNTTTLFISPVSYESFMSGSDEYLTTLQERIESRRRSFEYVSKKIAKAALYRELFLESDDMHYIPNRNHRMGDAVAEVHALLDRFE